MIIREHAIYGLWAAWLLSWTVARFWTNRTEKRDAAWAEVLFRVLFYAGLILLFAFPQRQDLAHPLWQFGAVINWLLVSLTAGSFLFAWWARIHLGPLWSDLVAMKAGHRVVDTGPYAMVRHPIYSGLILAALATATWEGTAAALLGSALLTAALWIKARREERFLRTELGQEAYDAYARNTPMLVPFARV